MLSNDGGDITFNFAQQLVLTSVTAGECKVFAKDSNLLHFHNNWSTYPPDKVSSCNAQTDASEKHRLAIATLKYPKKRINNSNFNFNFQQILFIEFSKKKTRDLSSWGWNVCLCNRYARAFCTFGCTNDLNPVLNWKKKSYIYVTFF